MRHYKIRPTKQYRKDYKRILKSRYDIQKLETIIDHLASGDVLPAHYRDHALRGIMQGSRECHIGPDWLLRYKKNEDHLILPSSHQHR